MLRVCVCVSVSDTHNYAALGSWKGLGVAFAALVRGGALHVLGLFDLKERS